MKEFTKETSNEWFEKKDEGGNYQGSNQLSVKWKATDFPPNYARKQTASDYSKEVCFMALFGGGR